MFIVLKILTTTSNCHNPPTAPRFSARSVISSCGRTAPGNFIALIAVRRKARPSPPPAMPAVCASASVRMTPGTIGSPGKWPAKNGSSLGKVFRQRANSPGRNSSTSSMKINGARWGRPSAIGSRLVTARSCLRRGRSRRISNCH